MNTLFLIMAEFETAEIPLDDLADKYLGLSPAQAHRGSRSQKAPWLVHAQDLANHLDAQREEAAREWKAINEAA